MNVITEKGAINMPYVLVGIRKDHLTDFSVFGREKCKNLVTLKGPCHDNFGPLLFMTLTHLDSLFIVRMKYRFQM